MGRPKNKEELLFAATDSFDKMNNLISSMTESELATPFDFSCDEKKTEAHWKRDKNLRDIYIHLYEWQQLLLKWVDANKNGDCKPFLPEPYNWKTYGDMNVELWKKHQGTSLDDAKEMLAKSHENVIALANTFSNKELFEKAFFPWTGTTNLGAYFISTTSSHYEWAIKKLKAHIKNCKG